MSVMPASGNSIITYRVGGREYPMKTNRACKVCFGPGTLIRTRDGFVPIEEVVAGDEVLTSDGKWHRVKVAMERQYDGKAYWLRSATMTSPVLVTPEHPIWTMQSTHPRQQKCLPWKCNDQIQGKRIPAFAPRRGSSKYPGVSWHKATDKWMAFGRGENGNPKYLGLFDIEEQANEVASAWRQDHPAPRSEHHLGWTETKDLTADSFVGTRVFDESQASDALFVSVPQWARGKGDSRRSIRNGPTEFALTSEFLWMLGLYLAEGSAGKRQIDFALHEKEIEYADRLVALFSPLGYGVRVVRPNREDYHGMHVVVSSSTLAEWFPVWLGSGSHNKAIPADLANLPLSRIQHVWQGVMDGDGCERFDTLGQTSEILALQMAEIALRRGGVPKITTHQRPERKRVWHLKRASSTGDDLRGHADTWKVFGETLSRVRSIEETIYCGPVYNLEVEDDHTYVVQNMLVHNCSSPYRFDVEEEIVAGRVYRKIVESLPEGHQLSVENVKNHYRNGHMPLAVSATREIVERRAQRVGKRIEDSIDSLIDGMTLAETVVQKTFERIASGEIKPDLLDGMRAAKLLAQMGEYDQSSVDQHSFVEAFIVYQEAAQEAMTPEQFEAFGDLLEKNPVLKALAARYDGETVEGEVLSDTEDSGS